MVAFLFIAPLPSPEEAGGRTLLFKVKLMVAEETSDLFPKWAGVYQDSRHLAMGGDLDCGCMNFLADYFISDHPNSHASLVTMIYPPRDFSHTILHVPMPAGRCNSSRTSRNHFGHPKQM